MNIHEYQGKALLKEFGLPVSRGKAIFSPDEAEAAARELGGPLWVVKSQIHAGGRGKGKFKEADAGEKGGVRLAKSIDEVKLFAREMLGKTLVTLQTGEAGKQVNRLYIEDGSDIESEFYLSMLVDRETGRIAYVVSTEGGMDIEQVAHDTPEKILTFSVDPATAVMPHHGRTVAKALGLTGSLAKEAEDVVAKLYRAFIALAMATLDIIKLYGEEPANFLDVGGGASEEKVTAAFKIITADPNVKGILVNIFGGIMKCDVIARGVIAAVRTVGLQVPLVVRLEGTNVEEGKKIIHESGLNVIPADDLDDAAQKIVNAVRGGK